MKANNYYESSSLSSSSLRNRGNQSPGGIARSMSFPETPKTDVKIEKANPPLRAERTIISRPSVGRTVEIDPERNVDFGRALRTLDIQCAVNRVRSDLQKQRFHERAGMKRKRLKSERWRKLFKESFKATVTRVKEMRRKGW